MISKDDIETLIKPLLDSQRIHLLEAKVSGRAGRPLIQLFVDFENENITIKECARVSREVQDMLDLQDWMPGDYQLIVSSPGIGYPLKEIWQLRKNIGRTIQTKYADNIITGKLTTVFEDGSLQLEISDEIHTFKKQELDGIKVIVVKAQKPNFRRK